jgi:hypothetical protein
LSPPSQSDLLGVCSASFVESTSQASSIRIGRSLRHKAKNLSANVLALQTQEQFEKFHSALGGSLSSYWKNNATGDGLEKELSPSHKLKLLDVFIKRACELELPNALRPNPIMNDKLLAFGHVPLDSLVFNALDSIFSGVLLLAGRSMGDVKDETTYQFYQRLIRQLMSDLPSSTQHPALYFEFYAWNLGREK